MQIVNVSQLSTVTAPAQVDFEGMRMPVHFRPGSIPTLVVIFHGAVNRKVRRLPFFQCHFSSALGAHQLSVADPCLERSPKLLAGWYAGANDIPLQTQLPKFFRAVCESLAVERTIYFGASAGGFAALYYAHAHAGSLAIAANPQTNLRSYLQSAVTTYREACWPQVVDNNDLAAHICTSLPDLYSDSVPNFACVLNASGDRFHLFNQTLELATKLKPEGRDRFVFHSDYYGVLGHSGAVPYSACVPWLHAAVLAPDWHADSILKELHQLRVGPAPNPQESVQPKALAGPSPDDERLADAIASWQLNGSK